MPHRVFGERKFTPAELEKLFGKKADARLAMKLKTEDPQGYDIARSEAEADGMLGPRGYFRSTDAQDLPWIKRERESHSLTEEAIEARLAFTQADCDYYYRGINDGKMREYQTINDLAKADRKAAEMLRLAAQSYGKVPKDVTPRVAPQRIETPTEELVELTAAECADIGAPAGWRATRSTRDAIARCMERAAASKAALENDGKTQDQRISDYLKAQDAKKDGNNEGGAAPAAVVKQ